MEMQDAPRVAVIMGSKWEAGAANAALLAAAIVALGDPALRERLKAYRSTRRQRTRPLRMPQERRSSPPMTFGSTRSSTPMTTSPS